MTVLRQVPKWLTRAVWTGAALLAIIGVTATVGRGVYPTDFATRFEPMRQQLFDAFERDDPFFRERADELGRFDGRFAVHPRITLMHIISGGVFLFLAPFQFSSRVRSRRIRLHRWSGRILLVAGLVSVLSALYFGILMPYGGPGEAVAIALVGGLFLVSMTNAFVAIRRGEVARHREWMLRVFAIAIAVSAVRVVAAALDVVLTPAGFRPPAVFVISLWTGWAMTLAAAEIWIRYTRRRGDVAVNVGGRLTAPGRTSLLVQVISDEPLTGSEIWR